MVMLLRKCLSLVRNFPVSRTSVISNSFNFTLKQQKLGYANGKILGQEVVEDQAKIEDEMSREVFAKVNDQIVNKTHGRLFAVVYVQGVQFKITTDDIIVVQKSWPPTFGDKIRLEKVMLVGCSDFTLIGRPLLPLDQVSVIATVIEKTFSHSKVRLTYLPRKNNTRCNFYKNELTFLRINSINLLGKVNELGDTDGTKDRIF